ncbi:MAG TPA: hypothetical protein VGI57_09745 [Usitatibacter sp.]|jgi:hypothetical protein
MKLDASRRHVTLVLSAAGGLLVSATALAIGIGAAMDRPATLMSPIDYRVAKASIEGDSHVALDKCLMLEGTVLGICRAEVQAEERTRRAALEAQYLGTAQAAESAREVRADAAYDIAAAKCDGHEGKARLACLKDAHTEKVKLLSQAGINS